MINKNSVLYCTICGNKLINVSMTHTIDYVKELDNDYGFVCPECNLSINIYDGIDSHNLRNCSITIYQNGELLGHFYSAFKNDLTKDLIINIIKNIGSRLDTNTKNS